jgi:hypothetical protein
MLSDDELRIAFVNAELDRVERKRNASDTDRISEFI